ncbi:LuxR family transcriptional regulator [bacterium]|nr:MAG: LuxR family transcriptional regulator [bacterium]
MQFSQEHAEFFPNVLSIREREVVELAVTGHTDEQIAQALSITTSTVNSYWVRIRGKVGPLSRSEIVGKMIHAGYREERALREAEIARLSGLLRTVNARLAGVQRQLDASDGVDWHLLALHFASEALLVVKGEAEVVYANLQAERLFGCNPNALVGTSVCELTCADGRERRRTRIRDFMHEAAPGRIALGVREPCFAHPYEGEDFRVTMVFERFDTQEGNMAIVTVKEFLADVEEIVRSLRKPIALE